MTETIFACSSGAPPAAVAVIRISGPSAGMALASLAGRMPEARRATAVTLRDPAGAVLDRALVLWLPGPATATGENIAEIHCHGGRAVLAALLAALARIPGLRAASAGEFTRRAFANGRIDLAEAEGLADLLTAETESQRQAALAMAGGGFSRIVSGWRQRVLAASAELEARLDFGDEDDVGAAAEERAEDCAALAGELADWLARPRAEALREGFRVVIAGPPNAGKSTLFNALLGSEAAITASSAGTTRDVLLRAASIAGVPFQFIDTAGLRGDVADPVEHIGIARAHGELARADLVLWLGVEGEGPEHCWEIQPQIDCAAHAGKHAPRHRISALTGEGMDRLRADLVQTMRSALPRPGDAALNARQYDLIKQAQHALWAGAKAHDQLLAAEQLRLARVAFDTLLGGAATEDMLDALFGRFCIGK